MSLSKLSVKSLWAVTRVTHAMAKGLRLRTLSLKRANALLTADNLAMSSLALGLTICSRDKVREYDLEDAGVVEVVMACLSNRVAASNEALMALNKAARDMACEKANRERWHEVRTINVWEAANKRGLDLTRAECKAATEVDDLETCSAYIERALNNRNPEPTTPAPAAVISKGNTVKKSTFRNVMIAAGLALAFSVNIDGAHASDFATDAYNYQHGDAAQRAELSGGNAGMSADLDGGTGSTAIHATASARPDTSAHQVAIPPKPQAVPQAIPQVEQRTPSQIPQAIPQPIPQRPQLVPVQQEIPQVAQQVPQATPQRPQLVPVRQQTPEAPQQAIPAQPHQNAQKTPERQEIPQVAQQVPQSTPEHQQKTPDAPQLVPVPHTQMAPAINGKDGQAGATGAQGEAGAAGANGKDGAAGANGKDGVTTTIVRHETDHATQQQVGKNTKAIAGLQSDVKDLRHDMKQQGANMAAMSSLHFRSANGYAVSAGTYNGDATAVAAGVKYNTSAHTNITAQASTSGDDWSAGVGFAGDF